MSQSEMNILSANTELLPAPSCPYTRFSLLEVHDSDTDCPCTAVFKKHYKLTLRVLFRVMHGEEQCERGADRLLATATQTAVLDFASKQFSDGRLTRRTQRTESSIQDKQIGDYIFLELAYAKPLCLEHFQTQRPACHKALFRI